MKVKKSLHAVDRQAIKLLTYPQVGPQQASLHPDPDPDLDLDLDLDLHLEYQEIRRLR